MRILLKNLFVFINLFVCTYGFAQSNSDTIVLHDIQLDAVSPACIIELKINSSGSLLQGIMYKANGKQKHPTLLLLHGFPGNEKNLDLAQVVRAHGWNVVYFNYRGSWGSQGKFSFEHCVEDVINVVVFCKKNCDSLQIDSSKIALFGHSMGGWVCLKALEKLPGIKKGFALSTWDIYSNFINVKTKEQILKAAGEECLVLNSINLEIYEPVVKNLPYYDLKNSAKALSEKQIIMLDEHKLNEPIADEIKKYNKNYFLYEVWKTDHPFTNKRVALMKKVLAFLDN